MIGHLADVSIRSLVLAFLAATALWILRRNRSVALTHAIWTTVMGGMLALFAFGNTLPRLPLRVLKSPATSVRALEASTAHSSLTPKELFPAPTPVKTVSTQPIDRKESLLFIYALIALALLARFVIGILLARKLIAQSVSVGIFSESNRLLKNAV